MDCSSSSSASSRISLCLSESSVDVDDLQEQQQHIIDLLKGQTFTIPYLSKSLPGWYVGVNPHYEKIHSQEGEFLDKYVCWIAEAVARPKTYICPPAQMGGERESSRDG